MQMQQLMQNPLNMPYQSPPQVRPTQIEEEDDDVEVVPKTQPQPSKKKNTKGNGKKEDVAVKQQQRPWSKIKEETLAKAYIRSSRNPILGNNQLTDGFWQEILDIFHAMMEQGEYRTVDSIGSKWRKMNTVIQRFCGFYNKTLTNKPSGWNNENAFNEALRLYEK
ncbi:glutathione S-transferase T3-like [Helianthus annuus]|uniref:glutathione S-transferase T3-like n=1 Tax=Helianthus annuus TaxID=4232 RepID=UPI000B8F4F20|nr:glutathione S-transferase T3-like [Helianthus annuus]